MSPFYTRTGDDGSTSQLGEGRLPKHHPRMEAIGTIDEASACLGMARASTKDAVIQSMLMEIQRDLYAIMAEIAATPENAAKFQTLGDGRVNWLEEQIELITERVPMPKEFILPGDSATGAAFAMGRTVVRRAERRVTELAAHGEVRSSSMLPYLNRLSSLCFVLELDANATAGKKTNLAKRKTKKSS